MRCELCGKEFTSKSVLAKYCSAECRAIVRNQSQNEYRIRHKLDVKTCTVCGKEFIPERRNIKCCSDACKARRKSMYEMEYKKGNRIKPMCEKPAKEIVKRVSHIDDIERYARAKGTTYAELQKQKTLSMAEPIKREI